MLDLLGVLPQVGQGDLLLHLHGGVVGYICSLTDKLVRLNLLQLVCFAHGRVLSLNTLIQRVEAE